MEFFPHPFSGRPIVLLASADPCLTKELRDILGEMGADVRCQSNGDLVPAEAMAMASGSVRLLLLDVRLPGVASGRLLAKLQEQSLRREWAIGLVAEEVSDEWIARLREGMIDDIVPRGADLAAWKTHIGTIQRGHALYCEVEYLRENTPARAERDPVTGTLSRDALLTVLFRETDRVQRLHGALSLMALGMRDLARRTAELGHDCVDQLLREVARRCERRLRTYDTMGVLDRERMLMILPGCSTINAVMLAERIRIEVFGEPFWVKSREKGIAEISLTACFGIILSRGRSPVVVLREAEEALKTAWQEDPGMIRCANDAGSWDGFPPQLFPEIETQMR